MIAVSAQLTTAISGYEVTLGTLPQALAMVGARSARREAELLVTEAFIQYYCSAVEDANPSYWSEDFARRAWGGIVAPPGMLQSWIIPLMWRPEGRREIDVLAFRVPLPGAFPINVSTDTEFFEPVRIGDRLNYTEEFLSVTEERSTRVGTGHFVTTAMEFRNQHNVLLACSTNVLFRYNPA
jgi:uncharacterized protein